MPKVFTSETQKIGQLGEDICCRYLQGKGFEIIERNYTRKWGEIDIIARKQGVTHFVEVKSQSVRDILVVSRDGYRAEDQMHPQKIVRLSRTINTYLLEMDVRNEWQFDVAVVLLEMEGKRAKVELLENIIL